MSTSALPQAAELTEAAGCTPRDRSSAMRIAQSLLLTPFDLDQCHLSGVLDTILRQGMDYADLYFQYARSEAWSLEEGIVKSGSFNIEQGVGVRANTGEKTAFAYSDDIGLPALRQAAGTVCALAQTQTTRVARPITSSPQTATLYVETDPLSSMCAEQKVHLLERIEQFARAADPRVSEVMASLSGSWETLLIMTSDGRLAADVRPLVRLNITVFMSENGRREQGTSGGGGRFDYQQLDDGFLREHAHRAVHQARVNLAAKPAPAGTMTVVLGPGWPGILLHEAVGHGLEGDYGRKGSSAFAGRIGQRVAAKGVTVVDDGTLPHRRGSLSIDDEGTPTQRTVLIDDGILVGFMNDTLSARLTGTPLTGNGRRESFAHIPIPRMTNTCMENGHYPPEEIIASVKKGLYAVNFGGGQVDITSGKFVFSTAEAYLIENGRVTQPVKGATLIGCGPDVLHRVSLIGNDLALDPGVGTCGKDGQGVPVGVGQPTLRINELTVGGQQA
jgi:TldD protein